MPESEVDSGNMIGVLDNFPKQIEEAAGLAGKIKITGEVTQIIVAGMGGSGHPGDMLKAYAQSIGLKTPVLVVRDYSLPEFVGSKTLVFAISYSGNTEETISTLKNAVRKGCKIIVITSGGKLRQIADEKSLPLILVPAGIQPRLSLAYMFMPMLTVLANSGYIRDVEGEIRKTADFLRRSSVREQSRELASKLTGKIPLIYASTQLGIAAYIWKILINECSKAHAFSNVFPEMNHNEINAFRNMQAKYYAVILQDELDHERVRERMAISKDIISKAGVESTQIVLKGRSFITKLFTAILTGMYVSYYLALNYSTDPTPVPVVEELKARLRRKFRDS
ncbi:bifunctional phosphoglucose/phosphomannose isomerase [Candidatus Woesearchaeota archaeon]|nr:bifunctional phosphoglucose/phosphomannose isomerase [Candidatus Woesearchaeota archaeon]